MEEVKAIKEKVQTAARGVISKKSAKKSVVVKKKSTPAPADSDEDGVEEVDEYEDCDDEEEEEGVETSYTETLQNAVVFTLENAVNNKAIGMFLAFSVAIYFGGDQMSV
jgi:hypothetical protein